MIKTVYLNEKELQNKLESYNLKVNFIEQRIVCEYEIIIAINQGIKSYNFRFTKPIELHFIALTHKQYYIQEIVDYILKYINK